MTFARPWGDIAMRPLLLAALTAGLLLSPGNRTAAQSEARAVVEKAVAATGGTEKLALPLAVKTRIKGTLTAPAPVGTDVAVEGDLFTQPKGPLKFSLQVETLGQKIQLTEVMHADRGWKSLNGAVSDLDAAELEEGRKSTYVDRVATLVPLLSDKGFTLTALGESKVNDQPALGVKVEMKGQPEVRLFFDKVSGLLVKSEHQGKDPFAGKEVLQEEYYSDYREPDWAAADERVLKAAGVGIDGPALLAYLAKKADAKVDAKRLEKLIEQLGADAFEVREKASADLVAAGAAALPYLRRAAKSSDPEVARRAEECLKRLVPGPDRPNPLPAAVRLVALRRPAGATAALLERLTAATEPEVADEILAALATVAVTKGKPDPALQEALDGKDPVRRAAAMAVLGQDGGAFEKKAGRHVYMTGVKFAMKGTMYSDGKKIFERETLEMQFFNRFDDKVFAKPEPEPGAPPAP
jgi:hypothetical protein